MSNSCVPMDCSPPHSPDHGISQARILEWVAISFSRGSFRSRDRTQVFCITGWFFTDWATREASLPTGGIISICLTIKPGPKSRLSCFLQEEAKKEYQNCHFRVNAWMYLEKTNLLFFKPNNTLNTVNFKAQVMPLSKVMAGFSEWSQLFWQVIEKH